MKLMKSTNAERRIPLFAIFISASEVTKKQKQMLCNFDTSELMESENELVRCYVMEHN